MIVIPNHIFERVLDMWIEKGYLDRAKYRGLTVNEVNVFTRTGLSVPERRTAKEMMRKNAAETQCFIRFQYENQFFMMYRTTWEYVVNRRWEKGAFEY